LLQRSRSRWTGREPKLATADSAVEQVAEEKIDAKLAGSRREERSGRG